MKMADVKVGMRLCSTMTGAASPITVTELTARGFKYRLDGPRPLIPRWGMSLAADGHEHFGFDGEALYEPEASPGDVPGGSDLVPGRT